MAEETNGTGLWDALKKGGTVTVNMEGKVYQFPLSQLSDTIGSVSDKVESLSPPEYELPETTFDGTEETYIKTDYNLTNTAGSNFIPSWTLFCDIKDIGEYTGSSIYYGIGLVSAGNVANAKVGTLAGFSCGVPVTYSTNDPSLVTDVNHYTIDVLDSRTSGKFAIRRSNQDEFMEYTNDGKTWIKLEEAGKAAESTYGHDCLQFGGYESIRKAGIVMGYFSGTMSAKFWTKAFDDMSIYF